MTKMPGNISRAGVCSGMPWSMAGRTEIHAQKDRQPCDSVNRVIQFSSRKNHLALACCMRASNLVLLVSSEAKMRSDSGSILAREE